MPDEAPAGGRAKSFFSNPLVLIGGGAAVLFLMLRPSGGGAVDTSGATASAVQQALTEEQAKVSSQLSAQQTTIDAQAQAQTNAINAALMEQQNTVGNQMSGNAAQLAQALNYNRAQADAATAASQQANTTLLEQIKALIDKLSAAQAGSPAPAPAPTGPAPTDDAIREWARGLRPDNPDLGYEWGKKIVARFGRLPSSIPELTDWLNQLGIPH